MNRERFKQLTKKEQVITRHWFRWFEFRNRGKFRDRRDRIHKIWHNRTDKVEFKWRLRRGY